MEQVQKKNILGTEPIGGLLRQFAVPSIIAMLVGALYNIVDQFFIGRSVGELGNAATNVAFPLTISCVALALLFGIGGAASFNLTLGGGDREKALFYIGNAATLLFGSGVILGTVALFCLTPMLRFFGSPPGDGLPARFLSCGLHQHTRRRALRHKRQTEAVFTGADQQLLAARADQERIGFTQVVRSVRNAVADAADERHADRHIARPIENRFHRPEAAPHLFNIAAALVGPLQVDRASALIIVVS